MAQRKWWENRYNEKDEEHNIEKQIKNVKAKSNDKDSTEDLLDEALEEIAKQRTQLEILEKNIDQLLLKIRELTEITKCHKETELRDIQKDYRDNIRYMQEFMMHMLDLNIVKTQQKAEEKKAVPSVSSAVQNYLDKKQNGKGLPLP